MKIGVFAVLFSDKPFEKALDYLVELGVEAVEIGTGAYPGNAHCDPSVLLRSERKLTAFREAIRRRGLVISALSCHGNPLHPQARIARDHHETFVRTVELAKRLDVEGRSRMSKDELVDAIDRANRRETARSRRG